MGRPSLPSLVILIAMLLLVDQRAHAQSPRQPLPNCKRSCGNVEVPYPFGMLNDISEDCYLDESFSFTCNDSFSPPKPFQGDVQVTMINLSNAQMKMLLPISSDCKNGWEISLPSIYRLSYTENVFTAVGCDTVAQFKIGLNNYGGCISGCNSLNDVSDGNCSGVGCCEASIPPDVEWYETNFTDRRETSQTYKFNPCSYSFVVEKGNYTFNKIDLQSMDSKREFPVRIDWAIGAHTCEEAKKDVATYACASINSICLNSSNGGGYVCSCSEGYQGNPYLVDGCQDINECEIGGEEYPCQGTCENIHGGYNCYCQKGFHSEDPKTQKCMKVAGTLSAANKLIIGIGSGLALAFIIILACGLAFQRRKIIKLREECFKKNGGAFLQHALASDRSTFKILTVAQIEKATNNFDKNEVLGKGGYGTVYKGKLEDGRIVAIKRSMVVDEKNAHEFANELYILSKINHRNIVKLLGCCLDDEVPMLVYEFVPKGMLFDYIHKENQQPIPFRDRLRIAVEAAGALRYLHTEADPPILHGDVKSHNILLDENHVAKVSDFGTSTLAPKDKTQFATFIQGTYGYLDPEYMLNGYLTDKSDVFSFGVILVELLTRRKPFDFNALVERERNLSINFITCVKEKKLEEILDQDIIEEGVTDKVRKFVEIALKCLNLKGEDRPSMEDVVRDLELLRGVPSHPWVQSSNTEEAEHLLINVIPVDGQVNTGTINHGYFEIEGGR